MGLPWIAFARTTAIALIGLIALAQGGGLLLNAKFPLSPPEIKEVRVLDRYTTRRKNTTTRWIVVESPDKAWLPGQTTVRVRASNEDYELARPGKSIAEISYQNGMLGLPMYLGMKLVDNSIQR